MAKLVAVCRDEMDFAFERRQIPLVIEESLTMVMEIPENVISSHNVSENQIQDFLKRYECLDGEELVFALMVRQKDVFALLSHSVPCVGCRRSVERLCNQLVKSGRRALEPLIITTSGILTVNDFFLHDPKLIYALFYRHGSRINELVEAIPKSRRSRRCPLHSLETHKSRPSGSWMDAWDLLSQECRDEVVLIDSDALLDTLEHYLRKHRFCSECKSKVLRAYSILAGDLDGPSEKGFCPTLYDGLKSCPQERHIHVLCDTDFIAHLIERAEPEIAGGRERHAKTLDIAQEEVLTCLGSHLWDRLHRLWQKLKAEEQTWQMLFYLGIDALKKSFEVSVEKKLGISRLEQVVEEISIAERMKELKREQKRLKKKARRIEKCKCSTELPEVIVDANEEQERKSSSPQQNGEVCRNGGSEDIFSHEQEESYEEDDDGDSVDTPCSCEDMECNIKKRRQHSWPVYRNGDCGYVGKTNPWCRERHHQNGTTCTREKFNPCTGEKSQPCELNRGGHEEEEFCSACLCASPPHNRNGKKKKKGKKKKGTKEKEHSNCCEKQNVDGCERMDDEEKKLLQSMGWTNNSVQDCCSSDDDSGISEQDILHFKATHKSVSSQRQELREQLRQKFEKMSRKKTDPVTKQMNGLNIAVVH